MVRLADWPRNPYLNDELREWVRLHLDALGVDDVAVYAAASGREDDERRILIVTEAGLLDGWYAPRQSTARYSLSVRLYPWQSVHGVDLRGETYRLWAHEHQSRWRLRLSRPAFDTLADTPELGRALTQFAAACSVMAEPMGQLEAERPGGDGRSSAAPGAAEEAAFTEPPSAQGVPPGGDSEAPEETSSAATPLPRPPIRLEPDLEREPGPADAHSLDLARRLGLR
ncbi:MAG TPA: hypothetical protein VHK63_08815 [Candidatus Limnocylindria bacterium]|nr:hypothetical protein [Candidatus Limnocylindria bacterium]